VDRPGFAHGAIGVAACWYGCAVGVADALLAAADGPHALAHLGAVDAVLAGARAVLDAAAVAIDADPKADAGLLGARVRVVVEAAATAVLDRGGRVLGAGPLCRDAAHARRVAGPHRLLATEPCRGRPRRSAPPYAAAERPDGDRDRRRRHHREGVAPHGAWRGGAPGWSRRMVTAIVGDGTAEEVWRRWLDRMPLPEVELADLGTPVVVAPHPDDEVLAVGGLLALAGAAELVAVTDGGASHPRRPP
jgi:hypothetical protein